MKFNIQALALSTGIVGVGIFGLFILWMYSISNMMDMSSHSEMMMMWSGEGMGFSLGNTLWMAILVFGFGWLVGWGLGTLYNKFSK